MGSTGSEGDELEALKKENARLRNSNEQNEVFKQKYIEVIATLTNLPTVSTTTATTSNEELLNKADDIVSDVVSSFPNLPPQNQVQLQEIGNEGASFLKRIEALEQSNAHNSANARYALSELEMIKQYLKIEHLLVHGLKDFPVNKWGNIVKGREFSEYIAGKFKELLSLTVTKSQILSCISVSHVIRSYKNPKNLIALVRFSNRDMRNMIFFSKKSLKGTAVSITEHLTPYTQQVLTAAKKTFGKPHA